MLQIRRSENFIIIVTRSLNYDRQTMKAPAAFFLLLVSATSAVAQGHRISGQFDSLPFEDFTRQVEQQVPVHFYYKPEWIPDIVITASGEEMDLQELLTSHLSEKDIYLVFLDVNKIVLFRGVNPVRRLPGFKRISDE